jgi:transposase
MLHALAKVGMTDPEINRSYAKIAAHYNVSVVPARPRKPKDKAARSAVVWGGESSWASFGPVATAGGDV